MKIVFFIIIFSSLIINSWPMFTGYFKGELKTVKIPEEYNEIYQFLSRQKDDFRVLIIPFHFGIYSTWAEDHIHNPFYISPPMPIVIGSGKPALSTQYMLDFLQNIIRNKELPTINLGKILSLFNIKYILVHKDIDIKETSWFSDMQEPDELIDFFKKRNEFKLVKDKNSFCIFENIYFISSRFFFIDKLIPVVGTRDLLIPLSVIPNLNFNMITLSFLDQASDVKKQIFSSDVSVFHNKDLLDLVFLMIDRKYKIEPSRFIGSYSKPEKNWCRRYFYPPYSQPICDLNYMGEYFNEDFIYSMGEDISLDIPFKIAQRNNYEIWIRLVHSPKQGKIFVQIDDRKITDYQPLSKDFLGFRWIKLGNLDLEKGSHVLKLTKEEKYKEIIIDELVIIPEQELEIAKKVTIDILQAYPGKMIYSFMHGFKDFLSFFIAKSGDYLIAINNSNSVLIDKKEYNTDFVDGDGYYYIGPLYLDRGNHTLFLKNSTGNSLVQYLFIYPVFKDNNFLRVKDIFDEFVQKENLLNFIQMNPTHYKVNINFNKSGYLIFNESFSPVWKAYVGYKNLEHMPLYSCLNGYYLDTEDTLKNDDIEIIYEKQKYRNLGFLISGLSLFSIISYLGIYYFKKRSS